MPSRATCANCLCSDDDDSTSMLSSGAVAVGDGLSALDVVGDEPSDPDVVDDRLSGEF